MDTRSAWTIGWVTTLWACQMYGALAQVPQTGTRHTAQPGASSPAVAGTAGVPSLSGDGGYEIGAEPSSTAVPDVVLKEPLAGKTPEEFAERLGTVLGVQVRLPQEYTTPLTVPAGKWQPSQLLGLVARQALKTSHRQWSWRSSFVFKAAVSGAVPPICHLPSAGDVTLTLLNSPLSEITGRVGRLIGCNSELPKTVPGTYGCRVTRYPVERLFSALAAQAGLSVTRTITLGVDDTSAAQDPASLDPASFVEGAAWLQSDESTSLVFDLLGLDQENESTDVTRERDKEIEELSAEAVGMDPADNVPAPPVESSKGNSGM